MPMSSYYRDLRDKIGSELLLIPAVAGVLRDEAGRILIQRDRQGEWSLPAGAVEPGESPAQAATREVYEETGLRVKAERVLGVVGGPGCRVTYSNGDRVEYVVTVFQCTQVGGNLVASGEETSLLRWFRPDEMPRLAFPYPDDILRRTDAAAYFQWDDAWTGLPR